MNTRTWLNDGWRKLERGRKKNNEGGIVCNRCWVERVAKNLQMKK